MLVKLEVLGSTEKAPKVFKVNPDAVEALETFETGTRVRLASGQAVGVIGTVDEVEKSLGLSGGKGK